MVKLVFSDSSGLISAAIRFYTFSDISHCGILLPDNSVIDSAYDQGGVKQAGFDDWQRNKRKVIVKEYPRLSEGMYDYCRLQLGKPYDLKAIIGLAMHRDWQDDRQWFCSEMLLKASVEAKTPILDMPAWRTFPQDILQAF